MATSNEPTLPELGVQFIGLVRDRDGNPVFDRPLKDYPKEIRDVYWRILTPFERPKYWD